MISLLWNHFRKNRFFFYQFYLSICGFPIFHKLIYNLCSCVKNVESVFKYSFPSPYEMNINYKWLRLLCRHVLFAITWRCVSTIAWHKHYCHSRSFLPINIDLINQSLMNLRVIYVETLFVPCCPTPWNTVIRQISLTVAFESQVIFVLTEPQPLR